MRPPARRTERPDFQNTEIIEVSNLELAQKCPDITLSIKASDLIDFRRSLVMEVLDGIARERAASVPAAPTPSPSAPSSTSSAAPPTTMSPRWLSPAASKRWDSGVTGK